jgi:dUTP pyrophosphatase
MIEDYIDLKIKKLHPNAIIPSFAKPGDAGLDLTAVEFDTDDYGNAVYKFGLAFEIPQGYVGLLFPRSSNATKDLLLSNSVGVIDSGYRGEVMVKFKFSTPYGDNRTLEADFPLIYKVGDRVAQLVLMKIPKIAIVETTVLSETERGEGGYGSTGK